MVFLMSLVGHAETKTVLEERIEQHMSEGIKHIQIKKYTTEGPLNINVLEVKLDDEYTDLRPIYGEELSIRRPLTQIAKDNAAVGAINGEFYSMNHPGFPFGTIVDAGRIITAPNSASFEYPTLIRQDHGFEFEILSPQMALMISGNKLPLRTMNKVGELDAELILLNSAWGKKSLGSSQTKELVEVVVRGDMIKSIHVGESAVDIPQDGYVVVFNSKNDHYLEFFKLGTLIELSIDFGFDIDAVDWAAGAVNHLVKDGQIHQYNLSVLGRHPRTAIGFNKDETKAYLITVDGRSLESIGARQSELAEILLEFGVWNGFNLDGGGSTQMALDHYHEGNVLTVNRPSDGRERLMVSGYGVYNAYPLEKQVAFLEILPQKRIFQNQLLNYEVKAYNRYKIPIRMDESRGTISAQGVTNQISEDGITFTGSGTAEVTILIEGVMASGVVEVMNRVEQLDGFVEEIDINIKETYKMPNFIGIDDEGRTGVVSAEEMSWQITPQLATIENGILKIGEKTGTAIITGTFDKAKVHIPLYIGYEEVMLHGFESLAGLKLSQYPATANGRMTTFGRSIEGNSSVRLSYDFTTMVPNDQAIAFVEFGEKGMPLEGKPGSLSMWVFGDRSNHWLRTRVVDAKGVEHRIDFEAVVDWYGWKQVTAKMPDDIAYPITLRNVYIANIHNDGANKGSILIDRLTANYPMARMDNDKIPKNTLVYDKMKKETEDYIRKFSVGSEGIHLNNERLSSPYFGEHLNLIVLDHSKGSLLASNPQQWDSLISLKESQVKTSVLVAKDGFDQLDLYDQQTIKRLAAYLIEEKGHTVLMAELGEQSTVTYEAGLRQVAFKNGLNFYILSNGEVKYDYY